MTTGTLPAAARRGPRRCCRGQALVETLLAFPLLLLVIATAVQLALLALAGLLVRHAAALAARAAAVTGGDLDAARQAASGACAPVDPNPEVRRVAPDAAVFADFGDRFPFDSADPARGARSGLTRAEAARVAFRVTCRLPLRVPLAGPLLARALGLGSAGRLALSAEAAHRLQSDPHRPAPPTPPPAASRWRRRP